jgi:hypothetical protein
MAVRAQQQAGKVPWIGYVRVTSPSARPPLLDALRQGLRELGWVEGRNIVIDYRFAEGSLGASVRRGASRGMSLRRVCRMTQHCSARLPKLETNAGSVPASWNGTMTNWITRCLVGPRSGSARAAGPCSVGPGALDPGEEANGLVANLRAPQVTGRTRVQAWSLLQDLQDCADNEPEARDRCQ